MAGELEPEVEGQVLKVADAIGILMEAWGFKRNMGRVWALLYLEKVPMSAADLGERLSLSSGAMSMLLAELQQWGVVRKTWVPGERREYFEAETSIWKMVSRVLRERELNWIRAAAESFAGADEVLAEAAAGARGDGAERVQGIATRVNGLTQLAQVGAHLIEAIISGESVDALPIKTMGELAQAAGRKPPER
ncbi:MAG TPA: MarR family transcriptional regulator [Kofleriaceae bacterium]|jgi:DNA-binding transcriptional regulator GbsR (MarR family)|nr:MarR family transcriptional regulator [Kofleriaceae bacterium]